MYQHVAAVTVAPVAGRHLRSPHARTRVDWWFVRDGGVLAGHGGEGSGLVADVIVADTYQSANFATECVLNGEVGTTPPVAARAEP